MEEKLAKIMLVVAALCITTSLYIFTSPNKERYVPPVIEPKLTEEEARGVVKDVINSVFEIYENPKSHFMGEEEQDNQIFVHDYSEVINNVFSKNGKKELEQVKFDDVNFVDKKEDGIYILANIPEDKKYSEWQLTTKDYYIAESYVTLIATFGKSTMLENGGMSIKSMTIEMKIVKSKDKWLVDSFNYNNL